MRHIASIDIGRTKIAASVVCEDGQIESFLEIPTQPQAGFPSAIERLKLIVRSMIEQGHALSGIGIGCPGPLDPLTGIIGDVGTLPTWQNGNLITELKQELGLSVDAATLAEHAWGLCTSSQLHLCHSQHRRRPCLQCRHPRSRAVLVRRRSSSELSAHSRVFA